MLTKNGHKIKSCRCNRIARLSREALERMRFELGRTTLAGFTVEGLTLKQKCPHGNVVYTTVIPAADGKVE